MSTQKEKRKFTQVKALGAVVTMEPHEVDEWLREALGPDEAYELVEIEMTEAEADALPEFGGY